MVSPAPDPVYVGLSRAQQRLEPYGIALHPEAISPALNAARVVLSESEHTVPNRAIELAIELVAIAATMRIQYGEKPLQDQQIQDFLSGSLRGFMNSFWHE